jgi:hypothetical protein
MAPERDIILTFFRNTTIGYRNAVLQKAFTTQNTGLHQIMAKKNKKKAPQPKTNQKRNGSLARNAKTS